MKWIGSGLVVAALTLVPASAAAQLTVAITGGYLESLGRGVPTPSRLTGTHGFEMETSVLVGANDLFASMTLCVSGGHCPPGTVVSAGAYVGQPNTVLSRDTVVRIDGEEYTDFDGSDAGGFWMQLSGGYTAPPHRGDRTVVVRTRVTLTGRGFSPRRGEEVVFLGNALATIVLEPPQPRVGPGGTLLPVDPNDGWTVKTARYDFEDPAEPFRWTASQLLIYTLEYAGLAWSEVRALGACRLLDPGVGEPELRRLSRDPVFEQWLRDYSITPTEFGATVRWAWEHRPELGVLCQ